MQWCWKMSNSIDLRCTCLNINKWSNKVITRFCWLNSYFMQWRLQEQSIFLNFGHRRNDIKISNDTVGLYHMSTTTFICWHSYDENVDTKFVIVLFFILSCSLLQIENNTKSICRRSHEIWQRPIFTAAITSEYKGIETLQFFMSHAWLQIGNFFRKKWHSHVGTLRWADKEGPLYLLLTPTNKRLPCARWTEQQKSFRWTQQTRENVTTRTQDKTQTTTVNPIVRFVSDCFWWKWNLSTESSRQAMISYSGYDDI